MEGLIPPSGAAELVWRSGLASWWSDSFHLCGASQVEQLSPPRGSSTCLAECLARLV